MIGVAAEGHGTVGSVWWTVAVAGVGGEAVGWRDADVAVGFDAAPVAIALEAGVRRGASSGEWVGVRAVGRVTRSFAMVGRAGRHHPDAFTGRVGGTRVEVGVRLVASSRADPLPTGIPGPPPPSDGMHRLTIRARAGADVRLVADWTDWRAVPVPETDPGVFSAGVRLGPGTHRFAFIVDGRWRTPDGYPTEPDGYGGEHAVVRVATRG